MAPILVLLLAACGDPQADPEEGAFNEAPRPIHFDGSSTVYPIARAVVDAWRVGRPDVEVSLSISGTGGGFKKFCAGEAEIVGASRPIRASETLSCQAAGIPFLELPLAYDGLAVVVHPSATFVDHLTVEELRTLWSPAAEDAVPTWSSLRPGWPDTPLHLYGPGEDSGSYDYFTAAVFGHEHGSVGDFTASEDDAVLARAVADDPQGLGYFGYAWYQAHADQLRLVPIDDGDDSNGRGPIAPSVASITNGTYQPFARPLFLYVSARAAERREVAELVHYALREGRSLAGSAGAVPLSDAACALALARFDQRRTGSMYGGGSRVGMRMEQLLMEPDQAVLVIP